MLRLTPQVLLLLPGQQSAAAGVERAALVGVAADTVSGLT
jgi:hypothetical protein